MTENEPSPEAIRAIIKVNDSMQNALVILAFITPVGVAIGLVVSLWAGWRVAAAVVIAGATVEFLCWLLHTAFGGSTKVGREKLARWETLR